MKHRFWLTLCIALFSLFTGHLRAQDSATGKWDEAKARETALAISNKWKFSPDDFQPGDAADLQHKIYAVLPFDVPGSQRRVLLIATAPPNDTCHACAPVTGAVIFAAKDGAWQPVYDQASVINSGSFGNPPNARTRNLGPSKPGIEFELNSMAQGYEATSLTFVAEVNHQLREVLSLAIGESNEAADMPPDQTFRWQAKVEISQSVNEGFADILVKSTGTKPAENGQAIRPYSESTTYRFNGEVYKKAE